MRLVPFMMWANPFGALGRSSVVAALIDLTSDLREFVRRMFDRLNAIFIPKVESWISDPAAKLSNQPNDR